MINLTLNPIPGMIAFEPTETVKNKVRGLWNMVAGSVVNGRMSKDLFERKVSDMCIDLASDLYHAGYGCIVVKKSMPHIDILQSACRVFRIDVKLTV